MSYNATVALDIHRHILLACNLSRSHIEAICIDTAKESEGSDAAGSAFQHVMKVAGNMTRANLSGLQPAHSYQIRIQAENREGLSQMSSVGEKSQSVTYGLCHFRNHLQPAIPKKCRR